jgi:peptidoglycan/LPS O-acetylase OafA/YrhL
MEIVEKPKRFGDHQNAFGFLRLILASLVIVSHTPELADGDRHRELLTNWFGSISFGEMAVDGFFIISGFLITASYLSSHSPLSYLKKRVARIYPGFLVASLICVAVVGPLAGGSPAFGLDRAVAGTLIRAAILCPPALSGAFLGSYQPLINGAAWTIQYEFTCYLIVLAIGAVGGFKTWKLVALAAIVLLLSAAFLPVQVADKINSLPLRTFILQGDAAHTLPRLIGCFLVGSAFFLVQDKIPLRAGWVIAALAATLLFLLNAHFATLGFALFGSYVLFSVAALGRGTILSRINNRDDISYGLYLYAWPIEKLLLWWRVTDNLVILGLITLVLAAAAGAASWYLVEKPVMRVIRRNWINHPITLPPQTPAPH